MAGADGRTARSAGGREYGPASSSPSSRLYRAHANATSTTTSSSLSSRYPASSGHPPLRGTGAGIVFRAPPSSKQHPASSPSASSRPTNVPTRRTPLPPSFPLFFGAASNQSSASIAPSTAEVRPAPVDGGTAALRELNTNFPSNVYRHRSAKSSGAQSTTYSQPVIVRTYNGPYGPGRGDSRTQSGSRPVTARTPLPASSECSSGAGPTHNRGQLSNGKPSGEEGMVGKENGVVNDLWTSNNDIFSSKSGMPRHPPPHHPPAPKKRGFPLTLPWRWGDRPSGNDGLGPDGSGGRPGERPKYPPLEAFTMRGIIQAQRSTQSELDTSLDQIAELYARSKYSLSNQYEVHVTPHGSGADFAQQPGGVVGGAVGARRKAGSTASSGGGGGSQHPGSHRAGSIRRHPHHQLIGPTLQATWSEDEADESSAAGAHSTPPGAAARTHRKRRSGGGGARRKSAAYGTLETIMSSSRSSSEEKEKKKKSAAELAEEVRGRAQRAERRNHDRATGPGSDTGAGQEGLGTNSQHAAATPGAPPGSSPGKDKSTGGNGGGSLPRKKASAAFAHAVIDSSRSRHDATSPRSSAAALVSEPALPQTSTGDLEKQVLALGLDEGPEDQEVREQEYDDSEQLRKACSADSHGAACIGTLAPPRSHSGRGKREQETGSQDPRGTNGGLLAGLNSWMPWSGLATQQSQHQVSPATDGLRDLLKSAEGRASKGKGVERVG